MSASSSSVKSTAATRSKVLALRDAKNCQTAYVIRAVVKNGKPVVERLANVYIVRSSTGATVKVGVQAWINDGAEVLWHFGATNGGGYDKVTAALSGAIIQGFTLGDHGDMSGNRPLSNIAYEQGWDILGEV